MSESLKLRVYIVSGGGVILRTVPMFSSEIPPPEELYLGMANSAHTLAWQIHDIHKAHGLDVEVVHLAGPLPDSRPSFSPRRFIARLWCRYRQRRHPRRSPEQITQDKLVKRVDAKLRKMRRRDR